MTPSVNMLAQARAQLRRHAPFSQMRLDHVDQFLRAAKQVYFAPKEVLVSPVSGVVQHLYCLIEGSVTAQRETASEGGEAAHYEAGDLFPVAALLGRRAVAASYLATEDTFAWQIDAQTVRALSERSSVFADFLTRRVAQYLHLSRHALQAAYAAQALAEQSMETALGTLARKTPLSVTAQTSIREALQGMHQQRIGSIVVVDAQRHVTGIFTRQDVLARVTLPQLPLETPIAQVMSTPVHCLDVSATTQDAVLLMSRHGLRHVPLLENGRLVSMVSQRDLFALQRLSLKQVSTAIRIATDLPTLRDAASDIRRLAAQLMGQGVAARQLTEIISHLNDLLTQRLLHIVASAHGLDASRACWVAFGSEGRAEQTIATDQDNGLILANDCDAAERARWLELALAVNQGLDACGYPLCLGQIMASNPQCCLTQQQWQARFAQWMEHGAPEDLLKASIYFDLRALWGDAALAQALRDWISEQTPRAPRFLKQMADNALRNAPPLNWHGSIDTHQIQQRAVVDLKLNGTALFVDVARLLALANGVRETGTRARLEAVADVLGVPRTESEAWIAAFEFLQLLRLRVQWQAQDGAPLPSPNLLELATLNDIDRRVLKESLRMAKRLQQRLELDYQR